MQCEEFRDLIEGYLAESLDDGQRAHFRRHLRSCPPCREWAMAVDPTLVFAAADDPPPDSARVELCAQTVLSLVRQQRLMGTVRTRRRPWLAAAAAVVVAVAGGTLWQLTRGVDGGPVGPPATEAPEVVTDGHTPPQVQVEMESEGVRVYQFADEGDEDTVVYFIVNPALEL